MRRAERNRARHRGAYRLHHFERKPHAAVERAAIVVIALVRQRRDETVQQIAVGEMQFDGVEPDPHRALGGIGETLDDMRHILLGHGARRMPARTERQRRRPDRRPGVFGVRQRLGAFPRPLRRSLAPGMRELNADFGVADMVAVINDALEGCLAGVGIKPEAAVGDTAAPLDMGRLDDQEPGAGIRQHAEMRHVPVVADAVVGAVLAHRRDDDAVGKRQIGKLYGREQSARHRLSHLAGGSKKQELWRHPAPCACGPRLWITRR